MNMNSTVKSIPNGTHTVRHASIHLGVTVQGSGPVCLMAPVPWGIRSAPGVSRDNLAKFLTMIFVDPRGVGQSGPVMSKKDYGVPTIVEDLEIVRSYFGIDQWHIMGQSAGGFTALEYVLAHPVHTASMMLVCTAPSGNFHKGTIRDKAHPRYHEVQELFDQFRREFSIETFRSYMRKVYAMDIQNPAALPVIDYFFASTEISVERYKYFATIELGRFDVTQDLERIKQRTLVIAGKHDIHVSPVQSERIAQKIPRAEYRLMEKSGHFPWLDEPELFQRHVREFIEEKR
jgi:proline iminopeptidase